MNTLQQKPAMLDAELAEDQRIIKKTNENL